MIDDKNESEAGDRRRLVWLAILATVVVRLILAVGLDLPSPMKPGAEAWDWAYEQGAVSAALERGDGFADPFAKGTGPTAWCGVVFPTVLVVVTRVTGGPNDSTLHVLAGLHIALGALIAWQLAALGAALGRARQGALAAWLWALHPLAAYYALTVVWDSHFVAAALLGVLLTLARAGQGAAPRRLVPAGVMFGVAVLVNPAALALGPALIVFVVRGRPLATWLRACAAYFGPALLVVLPLSIRNAVVLGTPNLKANLGVELLVGNNDDADGGFHPWIHPAYNDGELAEYRERGEVGYGSWSRARAVDWIRQHPRRFAELTLIRARNFWLGLDPAEPIHLRSGALKARDAQGWIKWASHFVAGLLALIGLATYRDERGGWWLVGGAAVLFPLVYYITHVLERYRLPLEPVLTYLIAGAILSIGARVATRRARSVSAAPGSSAAAPRRR